MLTGYLILINAAAFLLMLSDKQKARKKKWRIPEKVLIGAAVIGGSLGTLAGMYTFRHKTKHLKFNIGIPVILVLQIVLAVVLMT
ncbi:MAG: DUF1294 domain-containing protein [Oscillospiraceae bacterium]|nr:DUF1294 domain-containing protein [Oscillospiraceae bacterium]